MVKKMSTRSKKLQRKFLIRRVAALVVLVAFLGAIGWGIHAFIARRGSAASGTSSSAASTSSTASSKKSAQSSTSSSSDQTGTFRTDKAKASGIPDCSASDVSIGLSANQTSIASDGTITFTKDFTHKGSTDCLLDTSDDSMAIVISNSDGVQVWRSDACSVDASQILLGQEDNYQKTTVWNGTISNTTVDNSIASKATVNAAGHGCMNVGESAPHVSAGDYAAELINTQDDSMKSDAVKFTVS